MTPQQDKDRTEDRDWRRQQDEHADVEIPNEECIVGTGQGCTAHRALRQTSTLQQDEQQQCGYQD